MSCSKIADVFGNTKQNISKIQKRVTVELSLQISDGMYTGFNSRDLNIAIDLNNFDLKPLDPKKIAVYLFIRDWLDEDEKRVLKELWFTDRLNHKSRLMEILNVDSDLALSMAKELLLKIQDMIQQRVQEYEEFKRTVILPMGTKIFKVDLENDLDISYKKKLS